MDRRAKKIERDLLLILLAYLAGTLKEAEARTRGLLLIDRQFRLLVNEINAYYEAHGLGGQLAFESGELREIRRRITEEFDVLLESGVVEKSEVEVKKNVNLIALLVAYAIAGTIAESIALKTPGAVLVWHTQLDPQVCEECAELEGAEFDPAGEIPPIPLHRGCRCYWVIVFEEE